MWREAGVAERRNVLATPERRLTALAWLLGDVRRNYKEEPDLSNLLRAVDGVAEAIEQGNPVMLAVHGLRLTDEAGAETLCRILSGEEPDEDRAVIDFLKGPEAVEQWVRIVDGAVRERGGSVVADRDFIRESFDALVSVIERRQNDSLGGPDAPRSGASESGHEAVGGDAG
jgi:hypothetical protein